MNDQYRGILLNLTNDKDVTAFIANDPSVLKIVRSNITQTVEQTVGLIEYPVFLGRLIYSTSLTNGSSFATAAGPNITVTTFNGSTYVNDAKIIRPDVLVSNGVLHVIDKVKIHLSNFVRYQFH